MLKSLAFAAAMLAAGAAHAGGHVSETGLVTVTSAHDVPTTIDRLAAAVEKAGGTVFARVDHAAGAAKVDLELRPTELLIFGNPKLGTPAMQAAQTMGMDLPLRAVAWEDEAGVVHLSYTDAATMAARHGISGDAEFVGKMTGALGKLTGAATSE
ncbi:MAG: DUF302 domain-containing protein [Pseudomonadota bacterium]